MTGNDVAAVVAAISAVLGTGYGTWRLARADKVKAGVDASAFLLTGYKDLQASITAEVQRVREQWANDIRVLKEEHEQDRLEWAEEMERDRARSAIREEAMQREIDTLRRQLEVLHDLLNRPPRP